MSASNVLLVGAIGLALGGAVAGKLVWTHRDGEVQRALSSRDKAVQNAQEWEKFGRAYEGQFKTCEANRKIEKGKAEKALAESSQECDGQIKAARSACSKLKPLVNKKLNVDKNNCPLPELYTPEELTPYLRPKVN